MSASIHELARAYARLGLQHWQGESQDVKNNARSIGVAIATNVRVAERVVDEPFEPDAENGAPLMLIPMPCWQKKVYAAFFAPWLATDGGPDELSFDLVVLLQQSGPIAFRFEPGSGQNTTHGYEHVQLSRSLGRGKVQLEKPLSPLPITYPAFPILSKNVLTRFLALLVAMHGFPLGVNHVFQKAFPGQATKQRTYWDMTNSLFKGGT